MIDNETILNRDVKSSLNGILGYTQLLMKTDINIQQRGYVENINSYSLQLLHNINNILEYNRLIQGKINIKMENVDVILFINNILNVIKPHLKGLKFSYSILSNIPNITVDKNKLYQIITNLILSLTHFENNSYISLTIDYYNGLLVFEIKSDVDENNMIYKRILEKELSSDYTSNSKIDLDFYIIDILAGKMNWKIRNGITDSHRIYNLLIPILNSKNKVLIISNDVSTQMLLKEVVLDFTDNITIINNVEKMNEEYDVIFVDKTINISTKSNVYQIKIPIDIKQIKNIFI